MEDRKMNSDSNMNNAILLRKHFSWLKGGKGYDETTVYAKEKILWDFESFIKHRNFNCLSAKIVSEYKKHIEIPKRNIGHPICKKTILERLMTVRDFYYWLIRQPGGKGRLDMDVVDSLDLSLRDKNSISTIRKPKHVPDLDYIKKLIDSIETSTEVGRRDRAAIGLLASSGLRIGTLVTLRLENIDIDKKEIILWLDPATHVHVKGGRGYPCYVFNVDPLLKEEIIDFIAFLKNIKGFTEHDPFFPSIDKKLSLSLEIFDMSRLVPQFNKSGQPVRDMLMRRSRKANLPYFNPHSFRAFCYQYINSKCTTLQQLCALSKNFGHKSINTSESNYGNQSIEARFKDLRTIDKPIELNEYTDNGIIHDLEKLINDYKNRPCNIQ